MFKEIFSRSEGENAEQISNAEKERLVEEAMDRIQKLIDNGTKIAEKILSEKYRDEFYDSLEIAAESANDAYENIENADEKLAAINELCDKLNLLENIDEKEEAEALILEGLEKWKNGRESKNNGSNRAMKKPRVRFYLSKGRSGHRRQENRQ